MQDAATKVGIGLLLGGTLAAFIEGAGAGLAIALGGLVVLSLALTEPRL